MRLSVVLCLFSGVVLVLALLAQVLIPRAEPRGALEDDLPHAHAAPRARHGHRAAGARDRPPTVKRGKDPGTTAPAHRPHPAKDKEGVPALTPGPHAKDKDKEKEEVPAPIDTADMHAVQAPAPAREQGLKIYDHCPRCPPGFAAEWCDTGAPLPRRVAALVRNLTTEEKTHFFSFHFFELPRIHWHRYNWWNEALHGVAREVGVTSFPQVILLAAAFNRTLWHAVASVISTEARARAADPATHTFGRKWMFHPKLFLTFWSPNVNIFRDPRWGRGHETPGEDPLLTQEYAHQFVTGLQGDDAVYLKTSACCKHFAAYSIEKGRFSFDAVIPDPRDLADTYFPAFKSCVTRSRVSGFMCSYNAINGVPACTNKWLLTDVLRTQWRFEGYVVSDCDGMLYALKRHKYTKSLVDTVAKGMAAGMELDCGTVYNARNVAKALEDGLISEDDMDHVLRRLFTILFRLGYFNPLQALPAWASLNNSLVNIPPHQRLALDAARQGLVLLKNAAATLPWDPARIRRLAVVGPSSNITRAMQGNYYGGAPYLITPLQGLQAYVPDVYFVKGCTPADDTETDIAAAEAAAAGADATVLFVGISGTQERENHDRSDIGLPGAQDLLIDRVSRAAKGPVALVLISGSSVDVSAAHDSAHVGAMLWAGYPGQSGGRAIADVLFGRYSPAGRLPVTFHFANYTQEVDFHDMNMRPNASATHPGRTYRFYRRPVLYPFGHGLSYTSFAYAMRCPTDVPFATAARDLQATRRTPHEAAVVASVTVHVRNTGARPSDHVVLLFVAAPGAGTDGAPAKTLAAFERVRVEVGLRETVELGLTSHHFSLASPESGRFAVRRGPWAVTVGDELCTITVK